MDWMVRWTPVSIFKGRLQTALKDSEQWGDEASGRRCCMPDIHFPVDCTVSPFHVALASIRVEWSCGCHIRWSGTGTKILCCVRPRW